jgi:hypothetical protein
MDNLHKAIWEYFDDFYQPSAKGAAYPIPFLWAEEAHADAAVYEEQKKMNEWFSTFGGDPLKSEQWKVAKVLAKLCEENGWKHNEESWRQMKEHRYKIDPTPDKMIAKLRPKPKPQSNSLDIDQRELAQMMGDMVDVKIMPNKVVHVPEGEDAQTFVVAMLARENGYVMTEPQDYGYSKDKYKKVYRVR